MGIVILCSPLRTEPDWESDKTESEREALRKEMRAEELMWARRSVIALVTFLLVIAAIVLIVLFVTKR